MLRDGCSSPFESGPELVLTCYETEMILLVRDELELKCSAASLGIGNLYRDILPSSDNSELEAVKKKDI